MAAGPRRDTRGIVDAPDLFTRVRFRRREPAPALRPYLEHYWLIDWDLDQPYAAHVVPHPSVNLVLQRYEAGESARERAGYAEVAGIGLGLFTQKLTGRGRVCGVQFRPGGFRPFAPEHALSDLTGRRIDAAEVLRTPPPVGAVLDPADEDARVRALDACLLALEPRPDPQATLAMELVDRVRTDRSVRRVGQLARSAGLSPYAAAALLRVRRRRAQVGHPPLPHPRGTGARRVRTGRGLGTAGGRPRLQRPGPPRTGLHRDGGRAPDGLHATTAVSPPTPGGPPHRKPANSLAARPVPVTS